MDVSDLISFTSFECSIPASPSKFFNNNEFNKFDTFDQIFGSPLHDIGSINYGPLGIPPCNWNRQSIGRESLIPSDFFSRNSLNPRESLGILPNNLLNGSFREEESIRANDILPRDSLMGRESLGILNISMLDINFSGENDEDDVFLNDNVFASTLDKAFCFPNSRSALPSSISSSSPSFNTFGLEMPSKIYSASTTTFNNQNDITSVLSDINKAFSCLPEITINSAEDLETNKQEIKESINKSHVINSAVKKELWDNEQQNNCTEDHGETTKSKRKVEEEKYEPFSSVHMEASFIASKIADGSIFEDSFEGVIGDLNAVACPWSKDPTLGIDPEEIESQEQVSKSSEVPEGQVEIQSTSDNEIIVHSSDEEKKGCPDSHKSLMAKDIIQNLSELLNSSTQSNDQKVQGQQLLSSLSELINKSSPNSDCVNSTTGFSDSAPSGVTNLQETKQYAKSFSGFKKTPIRSENKMNNSISKMPNIKVNGFRSSISSSTSNLSAASTNTANSKNSSSGSFGLNPKLQVVPTFTGKVKIKKYEQGTKKGPVKAFPLENANNKKTSGEKENAKFVPMSNKTSTPNNTKGKPMACSTPIMESSAKLATDSFNSSKKGIITTPTNRKSLPSHLPSTSPKPLSKLQKSLTSGVIISKNSKVAKASNNKQQEKNNEEMKPVTRNRSNSTGNAGIMSCMNKVRENLRNSPEFKEIKLRALGERNTTGKKKTDKNSVVKPKALGKENVSSKKCVS